MVLIITLLLPKLLCTLYGVEARLYVAACNSLLLPATVVGNAWAAWWPSSNGRGGVMLMRLIPHNYLKIDVEQDRRQRAHRRWETLFQKWYRAITR